MASSQDGMPRATIIAALIGAVALIIAAYISGTRAGESRGEQQAFASATIQQATSHAVVEQRETSFTTVQPTVTSSPQPTTTSTPQSLPTSTSEPPTATPAPTQEPTPTPMPTGTVLYQADQAGGMDAWPANSSWKIVDKMLVNDGTTRGSGGAVIMAPFVPEAMDLDNYAVEVEIQAIKGFCYGSFGIIVRSGYRAGINGGVCSGPDYSASISLGHRYFPLKAVSYNPSTDWRTYRIEVQGNKIRLFINGARVLEIQDNTHTTGGEVGLWSEVAQVNVRSFKVISCNSC